MHHVKKTLGASDQYKYSRAGASIKVTVQAVVNECESANLRHNRETKMPITKRCAYKFIATAVQIGKNPNNGIKGVCVMLWGIGHGIPKAALSNQ